MSEPRTPQGDIPSLYSLAANGDIVAYLQLCDLYRDYIIAVVEKIKTDRLVDINDAELKLSAYIGIQLSFKKLELNSACPTYALWIEKNIRGALDARLSAGARMPNDG